MSALEHAETPEQVLSEEKERPEDRELRICPGRLRQRYVLVCITETPARRVSQDDGSYVRGLVHQPVDRYMVEAPNQTGHAMGMQTIAEIVEDQATLGALAVIVGSARGYGIARPRPLEERCSGKVRRCTKGATIRPDRHPDRSNPYLQGRRQRVPPKGPGTSSRRPVVHASAGYQAAWILPEKSAWKGSTPGGLPPGR